MALLANLCGVSVGVCLTFIPGLWPPKGVNVGARENPSCVAMGEVAGPAIVGSKICPPISLWEGNCTPGRTTGDGQVRVAAPHSR